MALFLGVDGGGTETKALIADDEGKIIGEGLGGSANYLFAGAEDAHSAIMEAIEAALEDSKVQGSELVRAIFGVPTAESILKDSLEALLPNSELYFLGEAPIAFASGSDKDYGVVILAGTGSFAWGRSKDGDCITIGGGGAAFGDEGSGFDIARAALREIGKMYDGRGPETLLSAKVCEFLGCDSFDGILSYIYGSRDPRPSRTKIAQLAPAVLAAAAEGDELAVGIVEAAAGELALMATTCVEGLGLSGGEFDLVLTGGVLQKGEPLRVKLISLLERSLPQARIIVPEVDPVFGAVALATRDEDYGSWYQYIYQID